LARFGVVTNSARHPLMFRPPVRSVMCRSKLLLNSASLVCLGVATVELLSCRARPNVVAVIPRTTSTMFWEAEHAGAEFAARKSGIRIRWNAPTREDDVQIQIGMVDRAIDERCRGLILAPDESRALMVPVQRALAAGVPTVVVGSALPLPAQRNLSYIVNDDEMVGRMAALRIGNVLNGKGEIAVVGIDPQSLSSLSVLRSFVSVLKENFPSVAIVDRRPGANSDIDSELIVNQILLSHPNVNAIFSLNSFGTVGTFLALKSRSLTDRVKVVGVQQSAELANAVRLHQIDALIAEDTYQMGYRAVELLAANQSPQMIKLSPILITAANVDAPEAKSFITNDWRVELQ
jgi:ribose transport system substrate-binding protein